MNLSERHSSDKPISTDLFFTGEEGKTISLRILKDGLLKEHITNVPAMLICITGEVVFENEQGLREVMKSGDYMSIEPLVKHWVKGVEDSQLLLMK